jgi:serine/threonine protein kinase
MSNVKPSEPTQPAVCEPEPPATEHNADTHDSREPLAPDDSREPFAPGDSHEPLTPGEAETELPTGDLDSDRDLEAQELLRAVAHAPPRRPRIAMTPGMKWGESGRYTIERRLGRGGMGTVYAATDTVLKRVVALKILDAVDPAQQQAHHARLLREAQLGARVEHERIARVYDVSTYDGFAFVAMEFVPGGTLRQWMTGRPLPVPQIVDIATQIAEGLAELHSRGVVHRDLKPENVMLTAQGGIKLLDFGLARHALVPSEEPGAPARTAMFDGASVAAGGTPGYMAPEQYSGGPIDARVDVFALGVILYELVTGQRLFAGGTPRQVMTATLAGPPELRDAVWDTVPPRLRDDTRRMLAVDPRVRFGDGTRALAALRDLAQTMPLDQEPLPGATVQTGGDTQSDVALPPPGRPRLRVTLKHAARASVVAGAITLLVYRPWQPSHHGPPVPADMVRIDAGTLEVGHTRDEIDRECQEIGPGCDRKQMEREIPRGAVAVAPFFLDKTEVSNEDLARMLNVYVGVLTVTEDEDDHYPRYVHRNPGTGPDDPLVDLYKVDPGVEYLADRREFRPRAGREHLPAARVSWFGAAMYCETYGKRLPTEDEWEAAARGRADRRFPWGSEVPRCTDVAIPNDGKVPMAGGCPPGDAVPVRATGDSPQDVTPDGIRDLAGNLAEWTASGFVEGSRTAPPGTARNAPRVIRGGSWAASLLARTSGRSRRPPSIMAENLGFRCAMTADTRP